MDGPVTSRSFFTNIPDGTYQIPLTVSDVRTSDHSATADEFVPVDATSRSVTVTLPAAPDDGARVGVKLVAVAGAYTVTVAAGAGDRFNTTGGATSISWSLLDLGVLLLYSATTHVWYVESGDPGTALDARYLQTANNLSELPSKATSRQNLGAQRRLTFTATKTAAYTAVDGDFVLADATAGGFTVTLPAASVSGQVLAVEKTDTGANAVTVQRAGSDTINGSATSITAALAGEVLIFTSDGAGSWWVTAGNKPLTSIDSRYVKLSVVTTKGDLLTSTGAGVVTRHAVGTDGYTLVADSGQADGVSWAPRSPNVQVFTASGTYTVPTGAKYITWKLISGGGGGGSGRKGAAGTVRCGGGGGGGGGITEGGALATDITSPVTVTVGAGGAGGTSVSTNSTNGNTGTAGTSTDFGAYGRAWRGMGGGGGTNATGSGGSGNAGTRQGGGGASASTTGGAGTQVGSAAGSMGGCAGGGITSGDVAGAGATGTGAPPYPTVGYTNGAAGVVDGTPPTQGYPPPAGIYEGGGAAGSGAASKTTNAQAGAAGIGYGTGGAGGGAALDDTGNSGAGGRGGDGVAVIVAWF